MRILNILWGDKAPTNNENLARNTDINGVVTSIKQMEDRFNKKFGYDYVLLNDLPFEDSFKTFVSFFCPC